MVLSVFYYGGMMMTESQLSVGDLSAFMLYAAYIGVSIGGNFRAWQIQCVNLMINTCLSLTDTVCESYD